MNRQVYPRGTTFLAAIAGALAWTLPLILENFLYLIFPFLPDIPLYDAGAYRIRLGELTIGYSLGAVIAGGVFLLGVRFLPMGRSGGQRPALSWRTVLAVLLGLALGGVATSMVAYGLGFTLDAQHLMFQLDIDPVGVRGPEPYMTVGLVLGVAVACVLFLALSGILTQNAEARHNAFRTGLGMVRNLCIAALVTRFLISSLASWSFFTYSAFGESILFYLLVPLVSGTLFGVWGWTSVSNGRP